MAYSEEERAKKREYYLRNAEKIKAAKIAYRKANREKMLAREREAYRRHREVIRARQAAYYQDNHAAILAQKREYSRRNAERIAAERAEYYRANKEIWQVHNGRRRARKAAGTLTLDEWRTILDEFDHRCAYCQGQGAMEIEHMVPLSRGGRHDKDNIVPACRSCNRRKYDRTIFEFLAI